MTDNSQRIGKSLKALKYARISQLKEQDVANLRQEFQKVLSVAISRQAKVNS